jgi:hypothetical protein
MIDGRTELMRASDRGVDRCVRGDHDDPGSGDSLRPREQQSFNRPLALVVGDDRIDVILHEWRPATPSSALTS